MDKTQSFPERIPIADITPGSEICSLLLVGAASLLQARNGPFWRLELKDASGNIEARIWSPLSQQYTDIPSGSIVEVSGRTESFREHLQLNVTALRLLSPEEASAVDVSMLLPSSKRPAQEMYDELLGLCKKVLTHKPWRKFVLGVLQDETIRTRLMTAPAAKALHHSWVGGLLEHTLSVASLCMLMCDHYPMLDRQTLLAGAVCHDLGKLWELSGGLDTSYTDEGQLIGHIVLGLEKLERPLAKSGLEPELVMHFKHLILSHHGLLEYGSPKMPQTAEAFALHHADDMDAKLAQVSTLFPASDGGEPAWSPYQRSLDRPIYQAPRTPNMQSMKGTSKKPSDTAPKQEHPRLDQCSLL